jgi:hypothetical protein
MPSWGIKCIDRRPTAWLEDSDAATSKTASGFLRMVAIRVCRDGVSLGYPKDARSGEKASASSTTAVRILYMVGGEEEPLISAVDL